MSSNVSDPNGVAPEPEGITVSEDQPALQPLTAPFRFHNEFDIATGEELMKARKDLQSTANFDLATRVTLLESQVQKLMELAGLA